MKKYNVIYIHTHDSGRLFSPYGCQVPTDGLDAFAKDATVFTNAFCASPTCSPSRSALVTGQYPHQNGMLGLANRGFGLNDYSHHMANIFNSNGYLTALCGIQHEFGRYSQHEEGAKKIGYQLDLSSDCSKFSEKEMVQWDKNNVDLCTAWLKERELEKPFFLSFGFFSTHREYPDSYGEIMPASDYFPEILEDLPEVRKDFKGHLESLKLFDMNFTKIICALKENHQYENSIIIFTTDHGIAFPNAKCTLFDAGIRVALIMRVPGMPRGRKVKQLVSQVDIMPTLCNLLSLESNHEFDGYDFSPLFSNPEQKIRDSIFAEVNFHTSYEPIRCIRTEQFKYIRYYDQTYLHPNLSNIDNSISKNIYIDKKLLGKDKVPEQFYDLNLDPLEKNNLINHREYIAVIDNLRKRLLQIQKETNDPLIRGAISLQKHWTVNTNECVNPKSKDKNDFLAH